MRCYPTFLLLSKTTPWRFRKIAASQSCQTAITNTGPSKGFTNEVHNLFCAQCGKELGLWAKLSGQSGTGVCKTCHEQGLNRLETLARSVGSTRNLDQRLARGWLSQFEEIAQKFHTPAEEALPLRFVPLNNIFKLSSRLIRSASSIMASYKESKSPVFSTVNA